MKSTRTGGVWLKYRDTSGSANRCRKSYVLNSEWWGDLFGFLSRFFWSISAKFVVSTAKERFLKNVVYKGGIG